MKKKIFMVLIASLAITGAAFAQFSLDPSSLTGEVGGTSEITILPKNLNINNVVWSSTVDTVAYVTVGNGGKYIVNFKNEGTATITANINNGASTPTCQVTVNAAFVPVTGIDVPTTAIAGTPLTLTGTVVPSNATRQDITWSLQNPIPTGVSISGNTLITSNTVTGSVMVVATIAGGLRKPNGDPLAYTQNCPISVTAAPVTPTLGGTVTITGNPVFGETLTANTSGLTSTPTIPDLGELSYQWQRDGTPISGATSTTYTLVQADIGKTISVVVTAANCAGSESDNTGPVDKASQSAPAAPKLESSTTTSITLATVSGCEYSIFISGGSVTWQTSTEFSGLTPNTSYTFLQYLVETDTHYASQPSSALISTAAFTPVTSITNLPSTATAGKPLTLTGTVAPTSATNKTITWSVQNPGITGATISTISGISTLNTTAAGTVTVLATIKNGLTETTDYIFPFNITVSADFVPVTGITLAPPLSTTTPTAGTSVTLAGTVAPGNATNQTIAWSVQSAGTTGASISGSTLSTTAAGKVTVRATITNGATATTNYTQDFDITVNAGFVAVTNITGVPPTATAGTPLTLTGTVAPTNATNKTIVWSVQSQGTTGATISGTGSTLSTTAAGTVTVRATIVNGATATTNYTQEFDITVNAGFVAVTNITGVPTTATVGTPLKLTGTVAPTNATNQTITWTVLTAGATGATVAGVDTIRTTAAGTVTVRATITNGAAATGTAAAANYTKDFTITVSVVAFVPVTNITGIPATTTSGTSIPLNATVVPSNATNKSIFWTLQSAGTTGAAISLDNSLNIKTSGTIVLRATIPNGTSETANYIQDFTIVVTPRVANEDVQDQALKAWVQDGILHVSGPILDKPVRLYNLTGQQLYAAIAADSPVKIPLPNRGIYILVAGDRTIKVVN